MISSWTPSADRRNWMSCAASSPPVITTVEPSYIAVDMASAVPLKPTTRSAQDTSTTPAIRCTDLRDDIARHGLPIGAHASVSAGTQHLTKPVVAVEE